MLPQDGITANGLKDVAKNRTFPNATRMLRRELECFNGFWTLPILGPGCSTRKWNAPHVTGLIRIWLGCIFGNTEVPFFFLPSFTHLLIQLHGRQSRQAPCRSVKNVSSFSMLRPAPSKVGNPFLT
jgi:hypothetical protein